MSGTYFNVCSPREVGLARFVVARLGRPEWLDIPWVHGTSSLRLEADIEEDPKDFPPPLMAEASLVSLALQIGGLDSLRDLSESLLSFAFFPGVTRERVASLLVAKGFEERQLSTGVPAEIARERTPSEARASLFSTSRYTPDTPLARTLLLELCDEDPARGARVFSRLSGSSLLFSANEADREHLARVAERVALHLEPTHFASFFALCTRVGFSTSELKHLASRVPSVAGEAPYLTGAVVRAMYPRCAIETKKKLLERDAKLHDLGIADADPALRAHVAWMVTLPSHVATLSEDPDPVVRAALSRNHRVDGPTLDRLVSAHDATEEVARNVAAHPNSTATTLMRLVDHPQADVRSSIAKHKALSAEAALKLAEDPAAMVRLMIVSRADLPAERRLAFRLDPDADVRAVAIAGDLNATAEELAKVPVRIRTELRVAVAQASADPALLTSFAADPDRGVRMSVGHNNHTPLEVLERFSRDADGYVRGSVAGNLAAGAAILGRLAVDEAHHVRQMAAASLGKLRKRSSNAEISNAEVPPEIEEVLVDPIASLRRELTRQKALGHAVLEALVDDRDVKVRSLLVRSKTTPCELLDRLATDADAAVRAAVAATPRASERALLLLVDDDDFAVRASARGRLAALRSKSSGKRKAAK